MNKIRLNQSCLKFSIKTNSIMIFISVNFFDMSGSTKKSAILRSYFLCIFYRTCLDTSDCLDTYNLVKEKTLKICVLSFFDFMAFQILHQLFLDPLTHQMRWPGDWSIAKRSERNCSFQLSFSNLAKSSSRVELSRESSLVKAFLESLWENLSHPLTPVSGSISQRIFEVRWQNYL